MGKMKTSTTIKRLQETQARNVEGMLKKNAALEKKIIKTKIEQLNAHIDEGKFWIPKVGDLIYVSTRLYIDHGEDDVQGGLATVKAIVREPKYTQAGNDLFIEVEEIPQSPNWRMHWEKQKEERDRYGTNFAYPDPDYKDYGPWAS
jgi:hypothetical protein